MLNNQQIKLIILDNDLLEKESFFIEKLMIERLF